MASRSRCGQVRVQRPVVLDEPDHAGELARLVADRAVDRVRAQHQQRHAEPEPHPVHVGRRDVIVEAAVVVPGHEDRRVLPHRRAHDRVDDLRGPVLAVTEGELRVLGQLESRRDPRDGRELVRRDVVEHVIGRPDVFRPALRVIPVAIDRRVRGPDVAALLLGRRVVGPRDPVLRQQIALRLEVEARAAPSRRCPRSRRPRPPVAAARRSRTCSRRSRCDAGCPAHPPTGRRSSRGGWGTTAPTPRRRSCRTTRCAGPSANSSAADPGGAGCRPNPPSGPGRSRPSHRGSTPGSSTRSSAGCRRARGRRSRVSTAGGSRGPSRP